MYRGLITVLTWLPMDWLRLKGVDISSDGTVRGIGD